VNHCFTVLQGSHFVGSRFTPVKLRRWAAKPRPFSCYHSDVPTKSIVFISCGQFTQAEIDLGEAVAELIRKETPFEPYFAEQQNTLDGLADNILSNLGEAVGFVAIMHHRGGSFHPTRSWSQNRGRALFAARHCTRRHPSTIAVEAG
jgi:hypothetical protein